MEKDGVIFSGTDRSGTRMEILEISPSKHPFFLATQFHPEFKSRPSKPSPPFKAFWRRVYVCPAKRSSFAFLTASMASLP